MEDTCELCKREVETTSHHLIPKQIHSKDWCRRMFTKDEMKNRRADLCGDCHPMVHQYFKHSELGKIYNTVEKLLSHDKVIKFVEWVSRQNKKAKR
jgi:hypothetical protein